DYQVPESRSVAYRNFAIHDYFFAKALEVTRPGGIVAFITSRYTMDKGNSSVREYLDHHGELLGSIRLPDTAFKKVANTEVTTDIIFLRKRETKADGRGDWTL